MTSNELKQWRKVNGYTQTQLAKALNVYQVSVSRWENDVRKIPSFLHLALRCLELEGDELLKGIQIKGKGKGGKKNGKCL